MCVCVCMCVCACVYTCISVCVCSYIVLWMTFGHAQVALDVPVLQEWIHNVERLLHCNGHTDWIEDVRVHEVRYPSHLLHHLDAHTFVVVNCIAQRVECENKACIYVLLECIEHSCKCTV